MENLPKVEVVVRLSIFRNSAIVNTSRLVSLTVCLTLFVGCKIEIIVPTGGDVARSQADLF